MLFCISIVKNKSRIIENLSSQSKKISSIKNDLYETQLDYFYLSSSENLFKTMSNFNGYEFKPLDISNIYSNFDEYLNENQKQLKHLKKLKKKYKKNNKINPNQKSFYFEDYLETKKKL